MYEIYHNIFPYCLYQTILHICLHCNMHDILYYLILLLLVNQNLIMSNISALWWEQVLQSVLHESVSCAFLRPNKFSRPYTLAFISALKDEQILLPSRSGAKPNFLVSLWPLPNPQPICLNVSQLTRVFWSCFTPYVQEKHAFHSSVDCNITSVSASMLLQC